MVIIRWIIVLLHQFNYTHKDNWKAKTMDFAFKNNEIEKNMNGFIESHTREKGVDESIKIHVEELKISVSAMNVNFRKLRL